MIDSIPLWFAIGGAVFALFGWLVLEFRASARYWAERDLTDPVVVTGSGRRRDHYPPGHVSGRCGDDSVRFRPVPADQPRQRHRASLSLRRLRRSLSASPIQTVLWRVHG